jgi:hypothetical protein
MTLERNANGTNYCPDCRAIVILFDEDVHDCPNDAGEAVRAAWARYERAV